MRDRQRDSARVQAERQRSRNALALPDAPSGVLIVLQGEMSGVLIVIQRGVRVFSPQNHGAARIQPLHPEAAQRAGASLVPIPEDAAAAAIIVVLARVGRAAALQDGP